MEEYFIAENYHTHYKYLCRDCDNFYKPIKIRHYPNQQVDVGWRDCKIGSIVKRNSVACKYFTNAEKIALTMWDFIEGEVLLRDNYTCRRCHSTDKLTVHHIISRRDGGPDTGRNLLTLCIPCHNFVERKGYTAWDKLVDVEGAIERRREKERKMMEGRYSAS